jgi:hypothetical protein
VRDAQSKRVLLAAARVNEGVVTIGARVGREFTAAADNRLVDDIGVDEGVTVAAEEGAVFALGTDRVLLNFVVDEGLRDGRVHRSLGSLPNQCRRVVDTEIFAVRFP